MNIDQLAELWEPPKPKQFTLSDLSVNDIFCFEPNQGKTRECFIQMTYDAKHLRTTRFNTRSEFSNKSR